ncbi:unnamed protein product [Penicillium salamii]|uniref:Nucleotide-diphospho-sugar transferase n=1 Tax=Penicillium salamii TaxID=1612424 RepID=A0A9W4N7A5_9EURO|nr:unnamed protein product [Penicillium salamii]
MELPLPRNLLRPLHTISLLVLGLFVIQTIRSLPSRYSEDQTEIFVADAALAPTHDVNWSRFAYVQYATSASHVCNSLMIFETLDRLHAKADRVLIYPMEYSLGEDDNSTASKLLRKARDQYKVKLVPVQVQSQASGDATWASSFTKLLAFNQTQYDRVLSLDSDATILKHMDELFLMPPCPIAMPQAYWMPESKLTSALMLITPSETEFDEVMNATKHSDENMYDMEIVNRLYKDRALVIPHDPYILLTGEFRSHDHSSYLGKEGRWDPNEVLKRAKYLHFSDWPVPKPSDEPPVYILDEKKPGCHLSPDDREVEDCRDRYHWLDFYAEYSRRREHVCSIAV